MIARNILISPKRTVQLRIFIFFGNMPKLPKIPYEAVSDYITPYMTFQLSCTATPTADFRTVQTVSLFGPTATSNRLNVTGPLTA